MNHSTCESRFSELEDRLKKHEELSKNLSKQLNEIKTQLVKMFFILKPLCLISKQKNY